MNYILHLLIMILIYLLLSYSINLLIGYAGLLSICGAAFYGIGAYIFTLTSMKLSMPFIPALLISILGSSLIGLTISIPALRLRGDYFVFVTLGFQMIVFAILYNWVGLTRGPYGIPGIPSPNIFGWEIDEPIEFLILILALNVIFSGILFLIYNSPFGLILKTLREDEISAQCLGKSPFKYFLKAFTISAGLSAVSGAVFASYMHYIDPTSFTLDESIFLVTILLLGGSGNKKGPFVGVLFMVLLPEALRFIGLPDAVAANLRQIIYGLILIVLMYFRPQGLAGEYKVK